MTATFSNIKNLNSTGIQTICVDKSENDKENIYVCDSDGSVLKFSKDSLLGSETPEIFKIEHDTSASIAWNKEGVYVGYSVVDFIYGSEKKSVGKFDKTFENPSNLLEFQLDITTIDANDVYVVAGSSDYSVKRVNISGRDLKSQSLEGEPISVKIDPKNEFVAVATVDGYLTILNLETFEVVHAIKNAFSGFESIDVSQARVALSWSNDGQFLYVPSHCFVKIFKRESWAEAGNFSFKNQDETFSTTSRSKCGKYLAASTKSNKIIVWDIVTREIMSSSQYTRITPGSMMITSIEFSPFSENDIIVADSNKGICIFYPFGEQEIKKTNDFLNDEAIEIDDDDDEIILNRTGLKIDQFEDEDDNTRLSSTSNDIAAIKKKYGFENSGMHDLEEYGFGIVDRTENDPLAEVSSKPPGAASSSNLPQYDYPIYSAPKKVMIPERFASGSTPRESSQRFLKYNQYGIVRSFVSEQAKCDAIDIEFHNKAIHGDINLDNSETNYELADISLKVVALASLENKKKEKELSKIDELEELEGGAEEKEAKGTSVLFVIPISSFDNQRWSVTMPRRDGILDVVVSETQIVVVTMKRNIRIFTISGVQRMVFNHTAPILTCACFDYKLAIASVTGAEFHEIEHKKKDQWRFKVYEYSMDAKNWFKNPKSRNNDGSMQEIEIPVGMGETLEWLGYSNSGKLVAMDSSYNISILTSAAIWVPIFDATPIIRSQSDGIFPIGVVETNKSREIRYIYCRGSKFPLINAMNAPTVVEWKVPFCQSESERAKNEQELFLNQLSLCDAISEDDFSTIDRLNKTQLATIVKLFALAVKSGCDGRAVELASTVTSAKGIQLLCNYASKNKKNALTEKIGEIGREMFENDGSLSRSGNNKDEEMMRPRKVMIGKKAQPVAVKEVPVEKNVFSYEMEDGGEEDYDEPASESQFNSSIVNSIAPLERVGANPFKKTASGAGNTTENVSVFDQLESINNERKRGRTEDPPSAQKGHPTKKQAKLNFGGAKVVEAKQQKQQKPEAATAEKENCVDETIVERSVTAYDLWLKESKEELQGKFDGDGDFSKFCIQSFRALTKEQKTEWKNKAQELST